MKNIFLFLLSVFVSCGFFAGCYEDKTNTDLQEGEVITIEGIEPSYTVASYLETLTIKPTVTSNKDADFEYNWCIYEPLAMGHIAVMDTIARTKDLSTTLDIVPKTWTLLFSVKNKLTGYEHITIRNITATTLFSTGWFILKDDGVNADVDLFRLTDINVTTNPNMIPESTPIENIISMTNDGLTLKGKGVKMSTTGSWRITEPDNTQKNIRVYVFTAENDILVTRASNIEVIRDVSNASYEQWTSIDVNYFYTDTRTLVLAAGVNGKHYAIFVGGVNLGFFGSYSLLNDQNPDYYMSKYLARSAKGYTMHFDELTSSFIQAQDWGSIIYAEKANDGTPAGTSQVEVRNNNLTCLYMGHCLGKGYGVFADKTTGKKKILSFNLSDPTVPLPPTPKHNVINIRIVAELNDADKANKATMYTLIDDEDILYFVGEDGNVYSRRLTETATEQLEFAVPQGETVTFIRHHRSRYSAAVIPSQIMIATSKGSGASATYNLRLFKKGGGSSKELIMELKGSGYARDYMNVFSGTIVDDGMFYQYRYL